MAYLMMIFFLPNNSTKSRIEKEVQHEQLTDLLLEVNQMLLDGDVQNVVAVATDCGVTNKG